MKPVLITFISLLIFSELTGQVNAEQQKKISQEVEKEMAGWRKELEKAKTEPVLIEFSLDTFRIEKLMEKCFAVDTPNMGFSAMLADEYVLIVPLIICSPDWTNKAGQ